MRTSTSTTRIVVDIARRSDRGWTSTSHIFRAIQSARRNTQNHVVTQSSSALEKKWKKRFSTHKRSRAARVRCNPRWQQLRQQRQPQPATTKAEIAHTTRKVQFDDEDETPKMAIRKLRLLRVGIIL